MIAREGLIFIISGAAIAIAFVLAAAKWDSEGLFTLSLIFGLLTIFTTFFFRDPERSFDRQANALVSPADGKVLAVETVNHPHIGEALKVSIFLNIFDVHINRIPATGTIDYVNYNPGKFFAAFVDKASELNEQTEIGMTTDDGHKVVFKQIAGLIARRIVCKLADGEQVAAGNRFGMIRFGSRTELFVPVGSRVDVSAGDHVAGGETIVGFLPSSAQHGQSENQARGSHAGL